MELKNWAREFGESFARRRRAISNRGDLCVPEGDPEAMVVELLLANRIRLTVGVWPEPVGWVTVYYTGKLKGTLLHFAFDVSTSGDHLVKAFEHTLDAIPLDPDMFDYSVRDRIRKIWSDL